MRHTRSRFRAEICRACCKADVPYPSLQGLGSPASFRRKWYPMTRRRYEVHHGVRISDGALVEAAVASDRYIADRFLPDKVVE